MRLYLVSRTDGAGYDEYEYDSFVVAAENEESALEFHPSGNKGSCYGWTKYLTNLKIEDIGESSSSVEKVILASFNAG